MVSDSELVGRLRDFLSTSDLNTTTTGIVRRKMEEDFGIDLSNKKAFIREQVDLYLQLVQAEQNEDEEEDGETDKEKSEENDSKGEDDEEEEEEEEEEESSEQTINGKGNAKRRSNKQNKEVKKRGGGFTKLCSLSPQLQEFTGVPELARTEVVKQLWSYIREKNLQDPSNRRNIICDDTLRPLFGVDSIDMFQMNKALAKHIWPLETDDAPTKSTQKEKQRKQESEEAAPTKSTQKEKRRRQESEEDEPKRKEKRQKGGNSGFLAPLRLSDALVKFFGTGESALSRADTVKRIWQYIKENNLQDPSDKRRILCDEKLKELFDVDSFNGFTVAKLLTSHFIKTEHPTEGR